MAIMINVPSEIKDEAVRRFLSELQRQMNSEIETLENEIKSIKNKVDEK